MSVAISGCYTREILSLARKDEVTQTLTRKTSVSRSESNLALFCHLSYHEDTLV